MVTLEWGIHWKQIRASQTEQHRLRLRKLTIVDLRWPANLSDTRELKMFMMTADTMMIVPM